MADPLRNEAVQAIMSEVSAAGYSPKAELRSKHVAVTWEQDGERKTCFTSATPSDHRTAQNSRAHVHRMLNAGASSAIVPTEPFRPRLVVNNGTVVASSRDIAEAFGKRHDHVLRDIDKIVSDLDSPDLGNALFQPSFAADGQGIKRRTYNLTRDGFTLIAMGFTGSSALKFKLAFIEAFNAMERALQDDRALTALEAPLAELQRLRGDLEALSDLVLEAPAKKVRKAPFVRPSVIRKMRRAAHG